MSIDHNPRRNTLRSPYNPDKENTLRSSYNPDKKNENTFYTNQGNNGTMETEDTFDLEAYKQTIEDTEDTIRNLSKTQYRMMLAGEDEKVDNLGKMISNLETVRDDLRTQLWGAMGAYSTDYPNKTPDWVIDSSIMAIPELSAAKKDDTRSSFGVLNLSSGNQANNSNADTVELNSKNETAAETDYEAQLAKLQKQLEFREDMLDSYAAYMTAEPYGANYDAYQAAHNRTLDKVAELKKEIKALEASGAGSAAGMGMGGTPTEEILTNRNDYDSNEAYVDALRDKALELGYLGEHIMEFVIKELEGNGYDVSKIGKSTQTETIDIDRNDYNSDDAYYKALLDKAYELGQQDSGQLKEFIDDNPVMKDIIKDPYYSEYFEGLKAPEHEIGPMPTLPSLDDDKGTIKIDGKEVPLVTWGSGYEDYSGYVVNSDRVWGNETYAPEMMASFKMEDDLTAGGSIVSGINSVLGAVHHIEVEIRTLNINGEECTLLAYYDARVNPADIYGTGYSMMTKAQAESKTPTSYIDLDTYFYFDEKHQNSEAGYIYMEDGKMMFKRLRYEDDKIVVDGKDVTSSFFEPFEIPESTAALIEEILNEKNYDLSQF